MFTINAGASVCNSSVACLTVVRFTVKPVFFACPLFREFREPDKFAKITGTRKFGNSIQYCVPTS